MGPAQVAGSPLPSSEHVQARQDSAARSLELLVRFSREDVAGLEHAVKLHRAFGQSDLGFRVESEGLLVAVDSLFMSVNRRLVPIECGLEFRQREPRSQALG